MKRLTIVHLSNIRVQVLWSSHLLFRLLVLFSVVRGLATAALPWMLDLWNVVECFCRNRVFQMNIEFCRCCSSCVIFRHNLLQRTAMCFTYFSFSATIPIADDVFTWFIYAIVTLETAALDNQNTLALSVTDAPAELASSICPLWKSYKSPTLQYFHANCY
jgi:hypothetical protein